MLKPLIGINDLKRYSAMPILNDIYTLKQAVDALRPFDAEREARILQKFRLEWNYNSNAIEGNSLTFGETIALLMNGVTAKGKPLKDHLDIKGHDEAIDFLMSLIKNERPLSEADIRQLHTILLKENYETDAITADGTATKKTIEVGKYKTTPNHVKTKTGQIHYYAEPNEVAILMCELVDWYNTAKDDPEIDTIVLAAFFHHRFVAIHPFGDGNGRMTRLLCNLILMCKRFPPIVIKKTDRETYYGALSQADTGEYLPFLEFIAEQTQYALHIQQRGALSETIDDDDDFEKELFLLEKMQKGNDDFVEIPYSTAVAEKVFKESFLPLFNSIGEKVKSAGKLFIDYKLSYTTEEIPNRIDEYIENNDVKTVSFTKILQREDGFGYISLNHSLKYYRLLSNQFSIKIGLDIIYEFNFFKIFYTLHEYDADGYMYGEDDFEYKNADYRALFEQKFYNKPLTQTEIRTATKTVSDALLQKIKELSSV
jgi:Fic family protein